MSKKITRDDVIGDARRVASKHRDQSFTRNLYRKHKSFTPSQIEEHFKTFKALKIAADLEPTKGDKDKVRSEILAELRQKYSRFYDEHIRPFHRKHAVEPPKKDIVSVAASSDWHGVFTDLWMRDVYLDMCERTQPDYIVWVGDVYNFGGLSRHDERYEDEDLIFEIEFVEREIWEPFKKACPNSKFVLQAGNHDVRVFTHLLRKDSAFLQLMQRKGMTIPEVLGIDKYEIDFVAKFDFMPRSDARVKKDLRKNKFSLFDDLLVFTHYPEKKGGAFSFHGHTHHAESWTSVDLAGKKCEHKILGSMCQTDLEYIQSLDSSVNGFGRAWVDRRKRSVSLESWTITDGFVVVDRIPYRRGK